MKRPTPIVPNEQLARCLLYLQSLVPSLEELDAEAAQPNYQRDLAQFIETWGVTPKLKEIRSLLLRLASDEQLKALGEPSVWHREVQSPVRPRRRRRTGSPRHAR